jgi:hypothetical protein
MRLLVATLALTVSFAASTVHAQEYAPPPPVAVVPAPQPWMPAPQPSGHELVRRGHQKKVAGAVLMAFGSALAVTGIVLTAVDDCSQDKMSCNARVHGPLWAPGVATAFVGAAALFAGIPTYIVGGYQVDKGRRLELTGFAAAPTLGANGLSGATASASFRF